MACKNNQTKSGTRITANEKYLNKLFQLLKKRETIAITGKKAGFNDTELRLIGEVLSAKVTGKRLISTQLATALGVTRSAVSQIVNHLEERGVVRRVADEVDRKIAYIEVTDEVLSQYQQEIKTCANFAGGLVRKYGVEKFNTMCKMLNDFLDLFEEEKKRIQDKTDE